MALLSALRNRSFAYLLAGQTVSATGDHLYRIALVWWVLKKTGSGEAVGLVTFVTTVPTLLFLLVGGVFVDRLPRTQIMIASDLTRGVLTAFIAVMMYANRLDMPVIYAIGIVFGVVDALFMPAYRALVPELVAVEDLPSANSLTALSMQPARVVGLALGALLVEGGGTALAFAVGSLSFFVSGSCLLAVRGVSPPPRAPHTSALREMREGLTTVLHNPWLWITILVFAFILAIEGGVVIVSVPFLVNDTFGLGIGSLSLVQSAAAIGGVLAAVWLGRRGRVRHRGMFVYGFAAVMGASIVTIGVSPLIYLVVFASLIRGAALMMSDLCWYESLQSTVPREKLGRVASIEILASSLLLPVTIVVSGWGIDHASARPVLVTGGLMIAALALLPLLHPRIRRFN